MILECGIKTANIICFVLNVYFIVLVKLHTSIIIYTSFDRVASKHFLRFSYFWMSMPLNFLISSPMKENTGYNINKLLLLFLLFCQNRKECLKRYYNENANKYLSDQIFTSEI